MAYMYRILALHQQELAYNCNISVTSKSTTAQSRLIDTKALDFAPASATSFHGVISYTINNQQSTMLPNCAASARCT